ncbi:hypothetical protein FRB99_002123 [Tulasnella sp. 403]|nr:hypothetical protein FRB99_002123 [Tulasnella sp. 403]
MEEDEWNGEGGAAADAVSRPERDSQMSFIDVLQTLLAEFDPQILSFFALVITVGLVAGTEMFENILNYIWNNPSTSSSNSKKSQRGTTSAPRTRAQQVAARYGSGDNANLNIDDVTYPGLVNVSGTYCFLNSTLQVLSFSSSTKIQALTISPKALASLSYLQPQLDACHDKAEAWDVPTPVIDALRDILNDLNSPQRRHSSLRPIGIINALSQSDSGGMDARSRLFSSREHQDAQELFQLLSSCIQEEAAEVDSESLKDRGLAVVDGPSPSDAPTRKEASKGVFEGLTANRRSCVKCNYTEAVMHFPFDNLTLPVPRVPSCKLEDCLAAYTHIETLYDCICRKCSILATLDKLKAESERLALAAAAPDASSTKKKKAKEAKRLQQKVEQALEEKTIEHDIKGLELEKVISPCSTKQSMIARAPPVLALHLNRSAYFGFGHAAKNSCNVTFPEILDLTPYTTSGALSTTPSSPISSHTRGAQFTGFGMFDHASPPSPPPNGIPDQPILYRLAAVVCHYGTHSFGHYITYRRKPRPQSYGSPSRLENPRLSHPLSCNCQICSKFGRIRDHDDNVDPLRPVMPNTGWLRISDDSVDEVGLNRVIQETAGTFMLYYERVVIDASALRVQRRRGSSLSRRVPPPLHIDPLKEADMHPYIHVANGTTSTVPEDPHLGSPRSSQETITPENATLSGPSSKPTSRNVDAPDHGSASVAILDSTQPLAASTSLASGRIVRNVAVALGRSRTASNLSAGGRDSPLVRATPGTPLAVGKPSPLPPGSSLTKFTPPTTTIPLNSPSPMSVGDRDLPNVVQKTKTKTKTLPGEPQAPARTVDLKA